MVPEEGSSEIGILAGLVTGVVAEVDEVVVVAVDVSVLRSAAKGVESVVTQTYTFLRYTSYCKLTLTSQIPMVFYNKSTLRNVNCVHFC